MFKAMVTYLALVSTALLAAGCGVVATSMRSIRPDSINVRSMGEVDIGTGLNADGTKFTCISGKFTPKDDKASIEEFGSNRYWMSYVEFDDQGWGYSSLYRISGG